MLAEFNGTILLVSHDRFLIDALATQIWEVVPGQSMLRIFEGSYSEYKAWLQNETTRINGKVEEEPKKVSIKSAQSEGVNGLSKNELQRLQKRMLRVEEEISQLEANLAALEIQLQNPPDDAKKVVHLGKKYSEVQSVLSQHMQLWEELALQLDRV
jgi:ATP-binding cassette subfamily F protein 3